VIATDGPRRSALTGTTSDVVRGFDRRAHAHRRTRLRQWRPPCSSARIVVLRVVLSTRASIATIFAGTEWLP
jgi:ribosomal protein L28